MTISRLLLVAVCLLLPLTMASQRIQQPLGRGVVAVNHNGNVTVTWRRLAQDPEDATYRVYADGNLLTTTPRTCWKTTSGKIPVGTQVTVSVVTPQGEELAQSVPFEVKNHDMRNIFRDKIREELAKRYNFYAMRAKPMCQMRLPSASMRNMWES